MPVPIAVAPMLISRISACASPSRSTSSRIVWPNAVNSWPSVIGTASCSCVRPILRCGLNSSPLARNAAARSRIAARKRLDRVVQRDLHRGRIDVVRRLAEVHVVVRVNRRVVAALLVHQLERAIRDHFVRVHVRRRAGAALDHVDHEVLVMTSGAQLLRRAHDDVGNRAIEQPELGVGQRRRFLHRGQRLDEHGKFAQRDAGDREVLERAQRLHAVQRVLGHVAVAEQVVLASRARAGEAERTTVTHERRVGRGEPLRDRACGARDERGVQRRILLQHLAHLIGRDHERLGSLHGARARSVRRFVEQHSFAERLTRAERDETNRDDRCVPSRPRSFLTR